MSEVENFDLAIIGGGPAGYTGAIRAAQLGMKVVCIEKKATLGGTCLNEGCIPSKALLNSSEKFEEAEKHFAEYGIETKVKLNLKTMLTRKDQIVSDLCKGIESLFAKNKITKITGEASFIGSDTLEVSTSKGNKTIKAAKILIATGSNVVNLPGIDIDEKQIVSSTGALDLQKVPEHLVVIGGGVIGLELGSVWRRLGSKVTVVEFADMILPMMDHEVSKNFTKTMKKQGIEFVLGSKVTSAALKKGKVSLEVEEVSSGKKSSMHADVVLVAIGRSPNTDGLGLDKIGVKCDERGRIMTDGSYATNVAGIFAVGDVIEGPMLAHKAEEEAVAAVEMMAGQSPHVNYNTIPSVIYTAPEVATVGATEEELKAQGVDYKVGKFPFIANSRARSVGETDGFVKLLADKNTDLVLGAHIIGPDAGTLIAEIVLGMEFYAASEDIARTCHAHPTLNEAVKEAALAVDKRTINM